MLSAGENDLLTRVGSGTPAGELLRRYWHPIAPASELSAEKPKKKVRLLGEDLVVFRDGSGQAISIALSRQQQEFRKQRLAGAGAEA